MEEKHPFSNVCSRVDFPSLSLSLCILIRRGEVDDLCGPSVKDGAPPRSHSLFRTSFSVSSLPHQPQTHDLLCLPLAVLVSQASLSASSRSLAFPVLLAELGTLLASRTCLLEWPELSLGHRQAQEQSKSQSFRGQRNMPTLSLGLNGWQLEMNNT